MVIRLAWFALLAPPAAAATVGQPLIDLVQMIATPLAGVIGVILGSLLTGRRARLNAESTQRYERKSNAYLSAIEPAFQLSDKMRDVVIHTPRGGDDPESDRLAGEAFLAVVEIRGQLDRHVFELRVIGSTAAVKAYEALRVRTDEYMAEIKLQLETDGIFRGLPGRKYLEDLDILCKNVLSEMRKDLGVTA
ncbi:hypothetical protein [Cryobacterium sp. PH31-L1]|uniref:hypothetical protein n=1 Tax=Cryobacterium sp. PH31-L1 TaxID=3046199 RepID=UPI0024BA29F9|nr:hypothetical protein [Cryobacterium sp. PH31-L1]MDJ0378497.1 hypothetical protein [Cryobacterium sp. PH31-L1]